MGKTWVLDTDTKGTGAEMVPLDRVLERPKRREEPTVVRGRRGTRVPEAPAPRAPRAFKVVDLVTREVLAEDVDARGAVAALEDVDSVVDVEVYVFEPKAQRWRPLTLGERKAIWEFRGRSPRRSAASPRASAR
jgi:hypothetical protein